MRAILCLAVAFSLVYFPTTTRLNADEAQDAVRRGSDWRAKGEYDKAIEDCNQALRLNPNHAGAYFVRGDCWRYKVELDKAIADYNEVLRINPKNEAAYVIRGHAWLDKGEHDKAIEDCNQALRLNPDFATGYLVRGNVWAGKGEYENAIKDYDETLRLMPDYVKAYSDLAWMHASCPDERYRDGRKAVANANRAAELSREGHNRKNWNYRLSGIVAAAYAEDGQFDKAVEWQTKAIEVAPEKDKEELRSRLELYKQGKPYHQEPKSR